jgi:CHAT domain-containing protein
MAVSVLPAVSSLAEIRTIARPSAAEQPFIGFGNPGFGGAAGGGDASLAALGRKCRVSADERADPALLQALAPLPETADEIKAMAAALNAPADAVVLGAAASEAEIRKRELSRYRVLAFATHGLLPGELACQNEPALAFTPGRGTTGADDGLLNASEIARLRLDADWVVLSACNTAGPDGSARGGQALSGLVRAFLYAGSRAVLATHWAVASEPTVTLTTGTFSAFAKPGVGRAEALRQSQLAMLSDPKTQHPVFWAPFVVVGEGGK